MMKLYTFNGEQSKLRNIYLITRGFKQGLLCYASYTNDNRHCGVDRTEETQPVNTVTIADKGTKKRCIYTLHDSLHQVSDEITHQINVL